MPALPVLEELNWIPETENVFFLGYKSRTKGYILYDLHSKLIFVTKNVIFLENIFS